MPIMSVPFNISTLLFLCVTTADDTSGLVRPDCLSFPERHRQEWRAKCKDEQQEESTPEPRNDKEEEAEQQKKLTHEEV